MQWAPAPAERIQDSKHRAQRHSAPRVEVPGPSLVIEIDASLSVFNWEGQEFARH